MYGFHNAHCIMNAPYGFLAGAEGFEPSAYGFGLI